MEYSSIQSTVRVDPVSQAIARANRHLEAGQQAEAVACLEAMLPDFPNRQDLQDKLREARGATVTTQHKSGGGRAGLLIVGVIVVAALAYWLFL